MDFIIYFGRLYPPVVIVTDTDWVQRGASVSPSKFRIKKSKFKKYFFAAGL